jgi:hypothetical protein
LLKNLALCIPHEEAILGRLEGVLSAGVLGEEFLLFCLLLILEEFLEAAVGITFCPLVQALASETRPLLKTT